jgi:hypothetical protein
MPAAAAATSAGLSVHLAPGFVLNSPIRPMFCRRPVEY